MLTPIALPINNPLPEDVVDLFDERLVEAMDRIFMRAHLAGSDLDGETPSGVDPEFAVPCCVADSPMRDAPGANRGVSLNPLGAGLLKAGYERPEPRAEAVRVPKHILE